MADISAIIEQAWAVAGQGRPPVDEPALQQQVARIRAMQRAGYQFRTELLYHRDGTLGAHRIGLFDTTGPALGLIEERCYTPEGERCDGLVRLLVDGHGKAPIGW